MNQNAKFSLLVSLFVFATTFAFSQKQLSAACGGVIESEFTNNLEQQDIQIQLNAGDMLEVTIVPIGSYLKVRANLLDPKGNTVIDGGNGMIKTVKKNEILKSDILSSNGLYTIRIYNWYDSAVTSRHPSTLGVYTAAIKCIKRSGEVIEPK